ncbi:polymer-forming cytoskeletal protein [Polynucleobacter sp. MWH-Spelu-300-X4]|jgi:cytoskeletal protein CcmA (bactofilin family)|uniref:bactofilin family protein n=1 Tax=Polynucleobacter sp. MWH-Spelu-300-X4 TaxID=2689109 RepID=UPI001BFED5B0|nr:polymer-forming cytoskeletal protein [Polynucleobacter sp. MWH-Spelu-300-X4]QWD79351.1 polymer-forming cytoskeletal protein [Polynucleobacter sp. MWH-Spelu-300-X4]
MMFGKRKSSLLVPTNEKFDTLVGKTTEIVGKVILAESLRIDGKISGNIECQPDAKVTVAIGQDGEVVGDIHAYRVVVAGKVEGSIYASERAEFHPTARVHGDVTYGSIGVEHGAKIMGQMIQGVDKKTAHEAFEAIRSVQDKR